MFNTKCTETVPRQLRPTETQECWKVQHFGSHDATTMYRHERKRSLLLLILLLSDGVFFCFMLISYQPLGTILLGVSMYKTTSVSWKSFFSHVCACFRVRYGNHVIIPRAISRCAFFLCVHLDDQILTSVLDPLPCIWMSKKLSSMLALFASVV